MGQAHRFDVVSGQHSAYTVEYSSDKGAGRQLSGARYPVEVNADGG
jgi:hypothetical protein